VIVVVGSGPAGVAAARALLDRGREVTLLDAGVRLEPERRARVERLAHSDPAEWSGEVLEEIRRQTPPALGGVPLKYSFGSDFPYQDVERFVPFENFGSATRPTLARGGFSTVWGAAALPYLAEDLADWPLAPEDLAPHYRAVTRWLPLSARCDDLEQALPLYAEAPRPLRPSRQATALMQDLERGRERLRAGGIRFGWSRLGVRAEADARGPGCVYCGLCMHGCPYGLIYDASATLEELKREPGFRYQGDVVVDRLIESGEGVEIRARSRTTQQALRYQAERVYLGCGVVSTTRLLLASLEAFDRPVELKDSQYFLLPLLRLRGAGNPRREALHTLSQVFLELRDPAVAPRNVHLQVYGFSDLFVALFERLLGRAARPVQPALDALLARLLLIQGYLHSDQSPAIRATLRSAGGEPVLVLEERGNPQTRPTLRRVARRLLRHAPELRALALWPALQVAPAGRGFHTGGSFPMRQSPGELECDLLGRPHGFSRVHVVDATSFPTVPATTITLSVMANAHRIASAEP